MSLGEEFIQASFVEILTSVRKERQPESEIWFLPHFCRAVSQNIETKRFLLLLSSW